MKKVLLLGDSIRMGYDDYVKEELDGKCEVVYDAEDNGRFAAYTLWQANQMFKHHGHFDVVHWNNGYWDMNIEAPMTEAMHPVEEYVHFLKRIIKLCRENGAKIIFATTTPILEPGMAADKINAQRGAAAILCQHHAAVVSLGLNAKADLLTTKAIAHEIAVRVICIVNHRAGVVLSAFCLTPDGNRRRSAVRDTVRSGS